MNPLAAPQKNNVRFRIARLLYVIPSPIYIRKEQPV